MKILITGGSGFLGKSLIEELSSKDTNLVSVYRNKSITPRQGFLIDSLNSQTDWTNAFLEVDVVIHCAARAHIMKDQSQDPITSFREINTFGTLNLARCAAKDGVKRFIFISSIKVSGETTSLGCPFKSSDEPNPTDPYAISKFEAEEGLKAIAEETGMQVVIIRPPLVYGPGVKGNFASLMKFTTKGLPLPLGAITRNLRSIVSVENLVDLIITCIEHPDAANQIFLVSDDHDVSTAELLNEMARADDRSSRLVPVPASLMQFAANLLGKGAVAERLFGSLQVDIEHTKKVLNWSPPISFSEGIRHCFYK